jgi:hypothetical protein
MAVLFSLAAGAAHAALSTVHLTGQFNIIAASGDVSAMPDDFFSGPVPFDMTIGLKSGEFIQAPATIQIGSFGPFTTTLSDTGVFHSALAFGDQQLTGPGYPRITAQFHIIFPSIKDTTDSVYVITPDLFLTQQPQLGIGFQIKDPHVVGFLGVGDPSYTTASMTGPTVYLAFVEPSTWAAMVFGFMGAGTALRRARAGLRTRAPAAA